MIGNEKTNGDVSNFILSTEILNHLISFRFLLIVRRIFLSLYDKKVELILLYHLKHDTLFPP